MTEPNRHTDGRGRWRWTLGFLETSAVLFLSPVLVKASLGLHLMHTQAQQRQPQSVDHLQLHQVAQDKLQAASDIGLNQSPCQEAQKQHIQ